jgi:hypothetical protein
MVAVSRSMNSVGTRRVHITHQGKTGAGAASGTTLTRGSGRGPMAMPKKVGLARACLRKFAKPLVVPE